MLFSSSLGLLLAGGVGSVVAQDGYGNTNHTAPGGNDSLANAPYSTSLPSLFFHFSFGAYKSEQSAMSFRVTEMDMVLVDFKNLSPSLTDHMHMTIHKIH
jgi:hypothetical protein